MRGAVGIITIMVIVAIAPAIALSIAILVMRARVMVAWIAEGVAIPIAVPSVIQ